MHYRGVVFGLEDDVDNADEAWRAAAQARPPAHRTPRPTATCNYPIRATRCGWIHGGESGGSKTTGVLRPARAERSRTPLAARRIMPTRLGNVLRRVPKHGSVDSMG